MADVSDRNFCPSPLTYSGQRLEDKVIIVFGASSGIGEAAVTRFALEGARVLAVARRQDRLDNVVSKVREGGGEAESCRCDVLVEQDIEQAVAEAKR